MLALTFLAAFLAVACGPVPALLARALQAPYAELPDIAWGETNAIVILGGGNVPGAGRDGPDIQASTYARLFRGYALYSACRSAGRTCMIVVSGGDPKANGVAEAELYRRRLLVLGVPPSALRVEPHSMNTFENARFTARLLRGQTVEQVVLVSSALHLGRAVRYFTGAGVPVIPVRADYAQAHFGLLPDANNVALADAALHESLGLAAYHVQTWLGWNPSLAGMNAL